METYITHLYYLKSLLKRRRNEAILVSFEQIDYKSTIEILILRECEKKI